MYAQVEPWTGDAPNYGANDGARLLLLADTEFRDHRPTVQLALALFAGERGYDPGGQWNLSLHWLGVPVPEKAASALSSKQFDHGGVAVLRRGSATAFFSYPRYRFRPGHCDALHVDLWWGNDNVLRDGGTYSYNSEQRWLEYFSGTESHNTVQFDDRDQMPLMSRFLRGCWLKAQNVHHVRNEGRAVLTAAEYSDWQGGWHFREVHLLADRLVVRDWVGGFQQRAVLRWRLQPGEWQLHDGSVHYGCYTLHVSANVPVVRCELLNGLEARYYLHSSELPVFEVEIRKTGHLTTIFAFKKS
jgi:hypothetical protein